MSGYFLRFKEMKDHLLPNIITDRRMPQIRAEAWGRMKRGLIEDTIHTMERANEGPTDPEVQIETLKALILLLAEDVPKMLPFPPLPFDPWHGEYDGTRCPNCERQRMMLCSNGKRRCEKCNYDPDAKNYSEYDPG
jgi:hypothetical protein